jgi:hypothetical protein
LEVKDNGFTEVLSVEVVSTVAGAATVAVVVSPGIKSGSVTSGRRSVNSDSGSIAASTVAVTPSTVAVAPLTPTVTILTQQWQ